MGGCVVLFVVDSLVIVMDGVKGVVFGGEEFGELVVGGCEEGIVGE